MNRLEEMQYAKTSKLRRKALFGELFSAQLAAWKAKTGKLERDFAGMVGVSKNVVTKWKQGERIPQGANLKKVCEVFGVEKDFFEPFDDFGEDFLFNTRAEAMSARLQQYAQRKGLDEDFYRRLISIPDFLRLFPFHSTGPNMELVIDDEEKHVSNFPPVKFEFRDSHGRRKMLVESDIDFIIKIQKRFGCEVLEMFQAEKKAIREAEITELIEWNLNHFDLDRDEVMKRINTVDFLANTQELTVEKVDQAFWDLAKEKDIKPHISRSEIKEKYQQTEAYYQTDDFKDSFWKQSRHEGLSEQQIEEEWQTFISEGQYMSDYIIESYIRRGFVIKD